MAAVYESVENFLRSVSETHGFDLNELRDHIISKKHVECGGLSIKFHNANLNELYGFMKYFNKEKVDYQVIRVFLYHEFNEECREQGIYEKIYGCKKMVTVAKSAVQTKNDSE